MILTLDPVDALFDINNSLSVPRASLFFNMERARTLSDSFAQLFFLLPFLPEIQNKIKLVLVSYSKKKFENILIFGIVKAYINLKITSENVMINDPGSYASW